LSPEEGEGEGEGKGEEEEGGEKRHVKTRLRLVRNCGYLHARQFPEFSIFNFFQHYNKSK